MIGRLIALGVAGFAGWEGWKWWTSTQGKVSMIEGHTYSISLNYTTDPIAPVSQQQVQNQLDAVAPGTFDVLSANMTPGAQSGIRQMALSVELVGPSQDVPASTLLAGWPVGFGKVTLASAQDMGAAPSAAIALSGAG